MKQLDEAHSKRMEALCTGSEAMQQGVVAMVSTVESTAESLEGSHVSAESSAEQWAQSGPSLSFPAPDRPLDYVFAHPGFVTLFSV